METRKVLVGSVVAGSSGLTQDTTREVEFVAEVLAEVSQAGDDRHGNPTDTRGTKQTLYKVEDGRLVVHVEDWSNWQGEPTTYSLHLVTGDDLGPTGWYWQLGAVAGMGRPLTWRRRFLRRNRASRRLGRRRMTGPGPAAMLALARR